MLVQKLAGHPRTADHGETLSVSAVDEVFYRRTWGHGCKREVGRRKM